ncbi:MAG: hypothetical protein JJT75_13265 [Opitutales bacterium]|nr:hypothetical protein [Opitutales bacterium]MCH8539730.1 hypothetical protein [Opitutales bacterium]
MKKLRPSQTRFLPGIITFSLSLVLSSCQTQAKEEEKTGTSTNIPSLFERSDTLPPTVPRAIYPPTPTSSDREDQNQEEIPLLHSSQNDPLPDDPVTAMNLTREMDIAVVLRTLAKGAEINLLLGHHVSGPVALSISKEMPWNELFEQIVEAHSLHYSYRNGLLRVLSREDLEKQIALEQSLRQREEAREARRRAEPLRVELYRARYANAEILAESLKQSFSILQGDSSTGAREQISIISDRDSGLLVIHAPSGFMENVLNLAQNLDQPAYQILIEASIVQTNTETARDLGVQWGGLWSGMDGGQVSVGTPLNFDGDDARGLFNANFPAQFVSEGGAGLTFGATRFSSNTQLQMQLTAMQREGELEIVSNPSITTLDKQTATIESGEERPFRSTTGTGLAATSGVEFKKALLRLEVTPQVIDDDWIKLHIITTKDDFDESRPVTVDDTIQFPIITRSATTTLYLADGQTTVIGGLSTNAQSDQVTGIPLLKDLPLLGGLFRSTKTQNTFNDTLIFLTPRIIPGRSVAEIIHPDSPIPPDLREEPAQKPDSGLEEYPNDPLKEE